MKKLFSSFMLFPLFILSCRTVKDMEVVTYAESENEAIRSAEKTNEELMKELYVEEELKEVDIEKTVIYVEKPVYYPVEEPGKKTHGKEAAKESYDKAVQQPSKYKNGKMFYDYDENFVYEIYCQPYRITDLALEPGELVLEMPFLSENQVWELGAGVSRKYGLDVQHFYIKPDISGLTTSMIIITDRRVYNLLLKSFKDTYMPMVEFEYPNTMPYTLMKDSPAQVNGKKKAIEPLVNPNFLSFDYKMSYNIFRKPVWLPKRVYDDGSKTYIQMKETVLHTVSPVLFNHRRERINYRVNKNLIVIDELIEKVTLLNGKERVVIKKKTYKEPKEIKVAEDVPEPEKTVSPEQRNRGRVIHAEFPDPEIKKQKKLMEQERAKALREEKERREREAKAQEAAGAVQKK